RQTVPDAAKCKTTRHIAEYAVVVERVPSPDANGPEPVKPVRRGSENWPITYTARLRVSYRNRIAVSYAAALYIRLKTDHPRRGLPIVSNLAATKPTDGRKPGRPSGGNLTKFNIEAREGAGLGLRRKAAVHANIPTGPVIDGRG